MSQKERRNGANSTCAPPALSSAAVVIAVAWQKRGSKLNNDYSERDKLTPETYVEFIKATSDVIQAQRSGKSDPAKIEHGMSELAKANARIAIYADAPVFTKLAHFLSRRWSYTVGGGCQSLLDVFAEMRRCFPSASKQAEANHTGLFSVLFGKRRHL